MRKQLLRAATFGLTLSLVIGMTGGALAYDSADFGDVGAEHWAYAYVMDMADQGIITGVGGGLFAPEEKVTAAMFLTLVGRVMFEGEAQAAAQGGDDWSSAYVRVADKLGMLSGTEIRTDAVENEISRYDMAVLLEDCLDMLNVPRGRLAEAEWSKVPDWLEIPNAYNSAAHAVYSTGLITGTEDGSFHGSATMTRAETATVISRLVSLKANPPQPEVPRTGETITFPVGGITYDHNNVSSHIGNATLQFRYKDGRVLGEGISDAEGNFRFDVTIDKADYDFMQSLYYFTAQYTDPQTGRKWERDADRPVALYGNRDYTTDEAIAWSIDLSEIE